MKTSLGRETTYSVEWTADGSTRMVNTFPSGVSNQSVEGRDGTRTVLFADGTEVATSEGPNPRWGMQAPVTEELSVGLPQNQTRYVQKTELQAVFDPANPVMLESYTETTHLGDMDEAYVETYDAATRRVALTSPEGRVRAVELDERGRVARYQVAELEPVELSYHPAGEPGAGKLASLVEGEGEAARLYELSYDQMGDLETITDPLGRTVSFGRDEAGRVTSQTLPDGRVVMYGYDENGNVTSVTPPGRPDHGFSYNALDGQESYEPPPPEAEDPGSTIPPTGTTAKGSSRRSRDPTGGTSS